MKTIQNGTLRLLALLAFICVGCQGKQGDACSATPEINTKVEGYLVIGDSISIGYTPDLKAAISNVQVTHTFCNAESSSNGINNIDHWLSYRPHWKLITINHGYWDIPPNAQASTPADYASNLRKEIEKARAVSDQVVFINTTAVLPVWPGFDNSIIREYNAAAEAEMATLGVPVIDLYTTSLSIPDRDYSNIHFTGPGYQTLAQTILSSISAYGIEVH